MAAEGQYPGRVAGPVEDPRHLRDVGIQGARNTALTARERHRHHEGGTREGGAGVERVYGGDLEPGTVPAVQAPQRVRRRALPRGVAVVPDGHQATAG